MYDLYKKVADDYPLKIEEGEWEKIAVRLNKPLAPTNISKKKNRNVLTPIILFFLLGGLQITNVNLKKIKDGIICNELILKNEKIVLSNNNLHKENQNITQDKTRNPVNPNAPKSIKAKIKSTHIYNPEIIVSKYSTQNEFITEKSLTIASSSSSSSDQVQVIKDIITDSPVGNDYTPSEIVTFPQAISTDTASNIANHNRFYSGLVFGPQWSNVKMNGFDKLGSEIGLSLDYIICNKFSLQSGLLLSIKKYYGAGKNFNMEEISAAMPHDMEMVSIRGSSTLLEIPLKLKYKLRGNDRSNFFISTGVSSYLLFKEHNDYRAKVLGIEQSLQGDYRQTRKYFAGTLNISIGLEQKIKNQQKVRIEPYIQIPIHGLGVGNMPVYSGGIHLGFSLPMK